jgi:hypothetical protein
LNGIAEIYKEGNKKKGGVGIKESWRTMKRKGVEIYGIDKELIIG